MLTKLKTVAAATAIAMALPVAASASTITFVGGNTNEDPINNGGTVISFATGGSGSVAQNQLSSPHKANVDFEWTGTTPNFLAYSEFSVDREFKLTFQDYSPEEDQAGTSDQRSGFQLYSGSFGSLTTAISGGDTCGSDVLASFGSTDCTFVTGADNIGTSFTVPPTEYGLFTAGTYVLMFSEGNNPNNGSAEFLISAVPVPAAGFLMIGALGGIAALRRRKSKKAA